MVKARRIVALLSLLCCLPYASYASEDYILGPLKGLLLFGGGLFAVLYVLAAVSTKLTKTLDRKEGAASIKPTAPDTRKPMSVVRNYAKIQWKLVLRVILLALPLNIIWIPVGIGLGGKLAQGIPESLSFLKVPLLCLALFAPHLFMAVKLWRTKRPSLALGAGLSIVLTIVISYSLLDAFSMLE